MFWGDCVCSPGLFRESLSMHTADHQKKKKKNKPQNEKLNNWIFYCSSIHWTTSTVTLKNSVSPLIQIKI